MTQQVPIADILAFVFSDAPVGAPVGYAGMSKSLYHTPTTGRVMAYFDSQPNSPAARCGKKLTQHYRPRDYSPA